MSITPKNKSSKTVSERERFIGFVYVLTLFIVITGACGFILFKYAGTRHIFSNKIMVIKKMERQKEFQNIQSVQIVSADTLFSRIEQFEPGVNASYEENDIKFLINDLAKLWSKQDNIIKFKKNLEECEVGLQKKEGELKNKGGKP